jgi:hypothetical protein
MLRLNALKLKVILGGDMNIKNKLMLVLAFILLLVNPILADNKPTPDPVAKAEADYQKYLKDRHAALLVNHDKFKNLTKITIESYLPHDLQFQKPKGGGLDIEFNIIGIVPDTITKTDTPQVVIQMIALSQDGWRYLKCKDLSWLVDGKPLKWLSEDYDGDTTGGASTMEFFSITLSPDQLEKLAAAKTIECKICNDEFVFIQKQFWVMRWVSEKVKELSKTNSSK